MHAPAASSRATVAWAGNRTRASARSAWRCQKVAAGESRVSMASTLGGPRPGKQPQDPADRASTDGRRRALSRSIFQASVLVCRIAAQTEWAMDSPDTLYLRIAQTL